MTKEGFFEISELCPEFNQFFVFPNIEEPPDLTDAACQTDANIQVARDKLALVSSSSELAVKEEPVDDYDRQNEFTQDNLEITEVDEDKSDEEDSVQKAKRARIDSQSNTVIDFHSDSVENIKIECVEMDNEFASIVPILYDPDENEEEMAVTQDNDDGEARYFYHIIHPVAPPTTIEFEENIGGLKNAPRIISVQMNSKENIVVCVKVGSEGYFFCSYLFNGKKKKHDIKPSGRDDYQYQLKMICSGQKRNKCNLKLVLFIRNKQISHPDFFKRTNFLIEGHLQKNDRERRNEEQKNEELENHLRECSCANSLQKTRDFYIKSVLKKNSSLEKPLSGSEMRRKISIDAGLTLQESAELSTVKSISSMQKTSHRAAKKLKSVRHQNGEQTTVVAGNVFPQLSYQ